jgi:hypothetical protein
MSSRQGQAIAGFQWNTAIAIPRCRHPASEGDHRLADEMRAAWVALAKTGTPACGTHLWPPYRPTSPQLAFLNDTVVAADFAPPPLFDAFRRLRDLIEAEENS